MRFNDAVFGVLFIVFAIAEISYARTFPKLHGQHFGPDLFPTLIGVGFILCGVVLIIRGLAARAKNSPIGAMWMSAGDWVGNAGSRINVALVLVATAFYAPASELVGFQIATFALLLTLFIRFETPLLSALALAAGVTVFIQVLFVELLLVPLPRGPIDFL